MGEVISNFIVGLFQPGGFANLLSLLIFILELLYLVFAFIIVRQVSLMNNSLKTNYALVFTFLAFVHFFAILGLVGLSVLVLF